MRECTRTHKSAVARRVVAQSHVLNVWWPRERKEGWWRERPATGNMTSLLAATQGSSGGVAAVSWILDVLVWRCRARLPIVLGSFLKCFMTTRMLVAGSVLVMGRSSGGALNFLETGGTGCFESCEKVDTPYRPQTWHHLHFIGSTP